MSYIKEFRPQATWFLGGKLQSPLWFSASTERGKRGQQMEKTGQSYSSGEWLVQPGSEEEFIQRWTNFLEWSLNNAPGAVTAVLVRSAEEPRRFLSLGAWENQEALERWRQMDQMQELLGQCRELCEEFEAHFYTLAANLSR
jgi:heme-degrading monooxygenase HmoA